MQGLDTMSNLHRPLHDFTSGIGRGIYSAAQMESHRTFQATQNSRGPVIAKITNAAAMGHAHRAGLGLVMSPEDLQQLKDQFAWEFFPLVYMLGELWRYLSTFLILLLLVKIMLECLGRAYYLYARHGCGRWMVLALCETCFTLAMTPYRLVSETAKNLTAPMSRLPATGSADRDDPYDPSAPDPNTRVPERMPPLTTPPTFSKLRGHLNDLRADRDRTSTADPESTTGVELRRPGSNPQWGSMPPTRPSGATHRFRPMNELLLQPVSPSPSIRNGHDEVE